MQLLMSPQFHTHPCYPVPRAGDFISGECEKCHIDCLRLFGKTQGFNLVCSRMTLNLHKSSAASPSYCCCVNTYIQQDQTLPQNTSAADSSWLGQQHCCLAGACWTLFMNGNGFRGQISVVSSPNTFVSKLVRSKNGDIIDIYI